MLQKVDRLAYKLQLSEGTQLHDVFHVNQIKKHLGPKVVPNSSLPLVTTDGKVKIAPLAVLDRRQVPRSAGGYDIPVPQWLIHWENMDASEATWEDTKFIQATFPRFKPWSLVLRAGHCQDTDEHIWKGTTILQLSSDSHQCSRCRGDGLEKINGCRCLQATLRFYPCLELAVSVF